MAARLNLAFTADLHWGHRKGQDATLLLAQMLHAEPPDVLVLAGDIGSGPYFEDCLRLFADLPSTRVLVPGNHDLWVLAEEADFDSLDLFERRLPEVAARAGFHYLDHAPLVFADTDLALVGSVNWYDYSWALEGLRQHYPDEEGRLASKRFTRGRHNDANFVRWPLDDPGFTALVAAGLERNLRVALEQVSHAIVVTHHPPFYGLSFPRPGPPVLLDSFLWDAFAGNLAVEQLLQQHAARIPFAFCGHTHCARQTTWQGIQGHNIGGDYGFKRLLLLDWPSGQITTHEFGQS